MKVKLSPKVMKKLRKIRRNDKYLYEKTLEKLEIFRENPQHNSLRRHKLSSKYDGFWSISIDMSMRMVYKEINDLAYFFDIGTHEEVYRK